jgi:hypothetical protein
MISTAVRLLLSVSRRLRTAVATSRRVDIGVHGRRDICEMSNSTELGMAIVLTRPYVQVHSARAAAGASKLAPSNVLATKPIR